MLPGSIINVGIYYGSLIDGFMGTALSACFMYLPCFLALCGILPQWRYYRDKPGIQRLIIGITCVTIGLSLAIVSKFLILDNDADRIYLSYRQFNEYLHIYCMLFFSSRMGYIPIYYHINWWAFSKYQKMGASLLQIHARPPLLIFVCLYYLRIIIITYLFLFLIICNLYLLRIALLKTHRIFLLRLHYRLRHIANTLFLHTIFVEYKLD